MTTTALLAELHEVAGTARTPRMENVHTPLGQYFWPKERGGLLATQTQELRFKSPDQHMQPVHSVLNRGSLSPLPSTGISGQMYEKPTTLPLLAVPESLPARFCSSPPCVHQQDGTDRIGSTCSVFLPDRPVADCVSKGVTHKNASDPHDLPELCILHQKLGSNSLFLDLDKL